MPQNRSTHLFVLGLDELNRDKLESVVAEEPIRVHPVLDLAALTSHEDFDVGATLDRAERQIRAHSEPVGGIINFWDFPVSLLAPILARRLGLSAPSLRGVLGCEHKYWSRVLQRRVAAEHVPPFESVDPFDDEALARIGVDYPFWIKPVKSFSSHLGFRVRHRRDLHRAIGHIRQGITEIGYAFNSFMERADLPADISSVGGNHCLVEGLIGGSQCTLEGFVHRGEMSAYGFVDSFRYPNRSSFSRYQYPSGLPRRVMKRMEEIARTVLEEIGLDDSAFNMEFFWDRRRGRIWILEINPRISQSHGDLFEKVDGIPHHQILVDLARGHRPCWTGREGDFRCAAKFFLRRFSDARVARVPTEAEIAEVVRRFPGALVDVPVREGMKLSDLDPQEQDSYSYNYAILFMGASSGRRLRVGFNAVREALPFVFEDP